MRSSSAPRPCSSIARAESSTASSSTRSARVCSTRASTWCMTATTSSCSANAARRAQLRTLLGKPSRHVGRERELAALRGLVDESVAEARPRCAVVTGASGLGKSRLVSEVVERRARATRTLVTWFARGDCMNAGSSFGLASDLLRDAAGAHAASRPTSSALSSPASSTDAARHRRCDRVAAALACSSAATTTTSIPRDPRSFGDRLLAAWEDSRAARFGRDAAPRLSSTISSGATSPPVRLLERRDAQPPNRLFCVVAAARPDVTTRASPTSGASASRFASRSPTCRRARRVGS